MSCYKETQWLGMHRQSDTRAGPGHLPLGRRGARHGVLPAAGPGTCWGGVRARVCLRPCLCINKPILGVQAWPGLVRQRYSV